MVKSKIENSNALVRGINIYYVGHEKCLPSHSFGPAIRQHYLFHYVIKGKGRYHCKGKVYDIEKDSGFLICPGDSTYYKADDKEPWEYCWISFDGSEALMLLNHCGLSEENLILTDNTKGVFKKSLLSLIKNYQSNKVNTLFLIGQFYICFSSLCEMVEKTEHVDSQVYLKKAIEYIHNNFIYDIKVGEIAKYIGIDRTYLYRLFVENIKLSPQEYIISFRVKAALNLLETTNMNVTEIAYSCGFKDTPTFCKHIKKRFKVTPLEYRKNKVNFII